MFDEVDEGMDIFMVTNHPPGQAHFVTYEDMPGEPDQSSPRWLRPEP